MKYVRLKLHTAECASFVYRDNTPPVADSNERCISRVNTSDTAAYIALS